MAKVAGGVHMRDLVGILGPLKNDQFCGHDCYVVAVMHWCTIFAGLENSNSHFQ